MGERAEVRALSDGEPTENAAHATAESAEPEGCRLWLEAVDPSGQACASVPFALLDDEGRLQDASTDAAGRAGPLTLARGPCWLAPAYGGEPRVLELQEAEEQHRIVLEDWGSRRIVISVTDRAGVAVQGAQVWLSERVEACGVGWAAGTATSATTLRALLARRGGVETRDQGRVPALQSQSEHLWQVAGTTDAAGRLVLTGRFDGRFVQATEPSLGASLVCRVPHSPSHRTSADEQIVSLRVVQPGAQVEVELLTDAVAAAGATAALGATGGTVRGTVQLLPRHGARWALDRGHLVPHAVARSRRVEGEQRVVLSGVTPGPYWVDFVPDDADGPAAQPQSLEVVDGGTVQVGLPILPSARIRGTVRRQRVPVAHARVEALGPGSRAVTTDASGRFELRRVAPGAVHLLAVADREYTALRVEVTAGSAVEVALELEAVDVVRGRVRAADGRPVEGIAVTAAIDGRNAAGLTTIGPFGDLLLNAGRTRDDGTFEVSIPVGGSATLTISDVLWTGHLTPIERRSGVRGGDELEFTLPAGCGSWSPLRLELHLPAGCEVSIDEVRLHRSSGAGLTTVVERARVVGGVAELAAVQPGTYTVQARDASDEVWVGELSIDPHGGRGAGGLVSSVVRLAAPSRAR